MSDVTPHQSDPATTPVPAPPSATAPPVVVPQESNRLNKAAAWVGIAAGAVFIVAVVFFAGFLLGKNVDGGGRAHHGGPGVMQPGPAGFPMGPPGGFHHGPGFTGPSGGGPGMDAPRPQSPTTGNAPTPSPRP